MATTKNNAVQTVSEEMVKNYNLKRNNSPIVNAAIKGIIVFHRDNDVKKDPTSRALLNDVIDGLKPISALEDYKVLVYLENVPHGVRLNAQTFASQAIEDKCKSNDILSRNFRAQIMTSVAGETVIGRDENGNNTLVEIQSGTSQVVGEYHFMQNAGDKTRADIVNSLTVEQKMALLAGL